MLSRTRKKILRAALRYLKNNNLEKKDLRDVELNPFPVSPRWFDNLIHADKHDTSKTFDFDTCKEFADFLELPNKRDGSVLIITSKKKEYAH